MRYEFDQFSFDEDRLELRCEGEVLRSEPRVLELLAYLLANRQELISRERLVDEVWQGQAVSESALTRCLYQLRKLLGENAQEPRYVHTVHGRGVRFSNEIDVREIDPPREGGKSGSDESGSTASQDPSPATPSPSWSPKAAARETPSPSKLDEGRDSESTYRPTPNQSPRSLRRFAGVLGVLFALAMVLLAVQSRWFGSDHRDDSASGAAIAGSTRSASRNAASGVPEPRPRLAILPLSSGAQSEPQGDRPMANTVGGSADSALRTASLSLADLVHQRLSTVPGLEVRPLALTESSANSADSLREVAERAGANLLLAGTIHPNPNGRYRVKIDLWEMGESDSNRGAAAARRTVLGTYDLPGLEADFAEFLRIRDAIAQRTAELIGSAFVFSDRPPGATDSPEAYRLYILAYQKLIDDFCGGAAPAMELFNRALEIDPEFGLAWSGIAVANYNRVWACGEHSDLLEDAMSAVDRALEIAPELRSPRFERISLLMETGKLEEAYARVLEEITGHPDEAWSLNAKAYALRRAGFLGPSAEALDRLLQVDPLVFSVGTIGGSPNTYLYQGRWDRFLDVSPLSEMAYHRFYRGLVEVLRDQNPAARAALEPAVRSSPNQVFGRMSAALLAILDDKPEDARAILDQIYRQRQATNAPDGEMNYKLAQLFSLAGDADLALANLEQGLDLGFFCLPCLRDDPLLDSLREDPRWAVLVDKTTARHLSFAQRFGLEPELGD